MHKLTKATNIPLNVKYRVWERDSHCCIICGSPNAAPNAHYIRRSHGGLGIEENVVTLCTRCHHDFDNGSKREDYGMIIKDYLDMWYPGFSDEKRVYSKYDWLYKEWK